MNTSVSKLASSQLDLPSASGSCEGAGKSSSYAQVAAQLGIDLSGSGGGTTSSATPTKRLVHRSPQVEGAARISPEAQIMKGLDTGRYHLSRLTESLKAVRGTTATPGLQGRLIGIEQQCAQLDLALQKMPANATPQQWMVLQQQMYSMSENIGTLSKMVSQLSSGMKSMLQTQV